MKVEIITNPKVNENVEPKFPYLAHYGRTIEDKDPVTVFVMGPGKDKKTRKGYMVNSNIVYSPFEYFSDNWTAKDLEPFLPHEKVVLMNS